MECAICFEPISKNTGKAELSCSHTFHLKCLSKWFSKNENCPCCRHKANETEKMYELDAADKDESEDDESDDDSDTSSEYDSIEQAAAAERARHRFRLKRWDMTEPEMRNYAATRISALVRGHQSRMFFFEFKCLRQDEASYIEALNMATRDLQKAKAAQVFYRKAASMTRPEYLAFSAAKIQSVWRGKKQKEIYKVQLEKRALESGLMIKWSKGADNTWTRDIISI